MTHFQLFHVVICTKKILTHNRKIRKYFFSLKHSKEKSALNDSCVALSLHHFYPFSISHSNWFKFKKAHFSLTHLILFPFISRCLNFFFWPSLNEFVMSFFSVSLYTSTWQQHQRLQAIPVDQDSKQINKYEWDWGRKKMNERQMLDI